MQQSKVLEGSWLEDCSIIWAKERVAKERGQVTKFLALQKLVTCPLFSPSLDLAILDKSSQNRQESYTLDRVKRLFDAHLERKACGPNGTADRRRNRRV